MKKLIILISALLLTSFAYAGEGDEKKSCEMEKECCCCESCESSKPEGKCCCAKPEKPAKAEKADKAEKPAKKD
jgi:hypothetical protein